MDVSKLKWCDPKYAQLYRWSFSDYYYPRETQIAFVTEVVARFPELMGYFEYTPYPVPGQDISIKGKELYERERPEILKKAKSGEEFIKLMTELLISLPKNGIVF